MMVNTMNILRKIFRRICRTAVKFVFPNGFRILLLRWSGVKVGKDVAINEGFTMAWDIGYEENLVIEDRVAIGPNVTIVITSHPNNSHLRNLKDRYPSIEVFGKVHIKHDAWIGAGAIILPNVTIGEFSIIGAGSVVTKDVPPYSIAVGVPARVVKKLKIEKKTENT